MTKVMVTIDAAGAEEAPTLEGLVSRYDLAEDDVDTEFGVVEIDPQARLFVILVEPEAAASITSDPHWQTAGPYSNPRIAPFGPPEPDPEQDTASPEQE